MPNSRFGLRHFFRLASSKIFSDMLQARRERVLGKKFGEIVWFRALQYWGTHQGYRYSGKVDAELHQSFYYPPGILSVKSPAARGVKPIEYTEEQPEG